MVRTHTRERNRYAECNMGRNQALLQSDRRRWQYHTVSDGHNTCHPGNSRHYRPAQEPVHRSRKTRHRFSDRNRKRTQLSVVLQKKRADLIQQMERAHPRDRDLHSRRNLGRNTALLHSQGQRRQFGKILHNRRQCAFDFHPAREPDNNFRAVAYSLGQADRYGA